MTRLARILNRLFRPWAMPDGIPMVFATEVQLELCGPECDCGQVGLVFIGAQGTFRAVLSPQLVGEVGDELVNQRVQHDMKSWMEN